MTATPWRLAVLGDPLDHTRSPDLHRAGLAAVGIAGSSQAIRTAAAELPARLRELALAGSRGTNLTIPLKEAALGLVPRVSDRARRARSANTIGFATDGWWADTTDGEGFAAWLATLGRRAARERVVLLGAGGAARSVALALLESGAEDVVASCRRPEDAAASWGAIAGARLVLWRGGEEGEALERATLVVNATPLDEPVAVDRIGVRSLLVDLRYGPRPTSWVRAARARGLEAYDGLGLLVFQARASLSLWTGRDVPLDPLARAVGWPR